MTRTAVAQYRTRTAPDGELVVNTAELFPDIPEGMVRVQPEGGSLVYGGVLHKVVARVIRPEFERPPLTGPSGMGLMSESDWTPGKYVNTDILLVRPVKWGDPL